ncbi:MAG: hypothetical protein ACXADY_08710 [Candidatus Hodarchaeales archaeon]|jgi:hypothetical protein
MPWTMIGVSIATCNFQLEIPDSFEMDTLADGSPIMEMIANGSSVEKTQDDNEFGAVFVLKTYNSTLLPKSYLLEINSTFINYIGFITPQWPQQEPNNPEGGGGAGITSLNPYITDFYAYNSKKGQKEHVKTWIYNPSDGMQYIDDLKYKIKAFDYYTTGTTPWEDWTQLYSENRNLPDLTTVVVHDYLDYLFKASSNKKYGLNKGDYKVTRVVVYGDGWSDSEFPGSEGEFDVTIQSGTHPVFVAHLVDQAFRNSHDEDEIFNDLEDWIIYVDGAVWTLKNYFGIDFHSYVFSWTATSPYDPDALWEELVDEAAGDNALGLSTSEWDHSSGGTQATNHGFDILFGHAWHYNTKDTTVGKGMYNAGVVVRGYKYWIFYRSLESLDRINMHEVLHTYYCQHTEIWGVPGSGWIMNANHYSGGGKMCDDNKEKVEEKMEKYDGV